MARGRFPGKRLLEGLLFLPVVIPEITQAISLAIFFKVTFDWLAVITGERIFPGFHTIIMAHVTFNISFVAIVVRARLADMDPQLEEAANDLGANPWRDLLARDLSAHPARHHFGRPARLYPLAR